MLDISNYKREISTYGGSELKMNFYIDGFKYMVKFPDPIREKGKNISYVNNHFSEYIGSMIFKLLGINTQEVELVTCTLNEKKKIVVACKDFLKNDETLIELKNISYSLNPDKKYTSSINDIYEMIQLLPNLENREEVINEFWRIFIVDTLIGNPDRHLGNIGFIKKDNTYRLSPVYDCGSSLNPLLTVNDMKNILEDENELKNVSYNIKTAYMLDSKKVTYHDIYENMNEDLKKQIKEFVPKINMDAIKNFIYSIKEINDIQKEFYYKTIEIRKREFLDKAYLSIDRL